MENKRLRPRALITLLRKRARQHRCRIVEEPGRGKGSHRLYIVLGPDDVEVGRITVPDHSRALSSTVLRSVERALAHQFGDRWLEEK
ncbi:putative RNA binding protein YcfA (HicA-like mRNA interferase family) [Actinokineospora baliensis]|uniref:hypothetical protein n=1 Tax=Actinokineospora baliensis TaxID=547056 RepID=UPI001EF77036|nr:hypothetical protein [Actinokineospora baliensis]MBM7772272.1 putative RNA binding protein YcfA (HicA-like mRNA interferase family) [Actinokineospora baliensis]